MSNSQTFKTNCDFPKPIATYEELIYNPHLFYDALNLFHDAKTKRELRVQSGLDMHKLFVEVTFRGGIQKVIGKRRWDEVVERVKYPAKVASPSFALRRCYMSVLYPFEQMYIFYKQIPDPPASETVNENVDDGAMAADEGGVELRVGSFVNGRVDGKFEGGYLISSKMGKADVKGVLYHAPMRRRRRKSQMTA